MSVSTRLSPLAMRPLVGRPAVLSVVTLAWVFWGAMLMPAGAAAANKPAADARSGSQTIKTGGFSYRVEPPPAWVVPASESSDGRPQNAAVHFALVDEQVRVEGHEAEFYRHATRVVSEPAGLASAAQIMAEFDPTFQRLSFHRLGVWRGGRYIDKLDPKKITLLQRETQLEYRVYDGQVTASTILDDVRVGDRIEYSYTVRGLNPVFGGKFAYTSWAVAQSGPIARFQLRLLAPPGRRILHRIAGDVTVAEGERDGLRETIFSRNNVPQFVYDPSAPDSVHLADQIQLSEFADWGEVARWGERLFAVAAVPTPAVRQRAEAIRAAATTPLEMVGRALDLVQNEVRYFGMEMGPNSHQPANPGTILKQRFGDCKDKTSLLIGLLRELGIAASPVLVSSRHRGEAVSILPGPFAFDHAIAQVVVDGRNYWLDGTRSNQTGPLADRQASGFGKALVLQAASTALADLPGTETEDRVAVDETFRITRFADEPALEARVTYFGELAEHVRQTVATQPLSQLEPKLTADYARLYPGIRTTAPLRFEEVPNRNAISIVQNFSVPRFWTFPEQRVLVAEVGLWSIAQAVKQPDEVARKTPLRLQWPGIHRHSISVEYPEEVARGTNVSRFDEGDGNFSFGTTYETSPRRAQIRAELRLKKDSVAAADWSPYAAKLQKMRSRFGATVSVPAISLAQADALTKDLRELEDSLRAGKVTTAVATRPQVAAQFRRIALTAQLGSGRLNPLLRAQTLRERGTQYDNMGMPDKAAADFEEALRLDPAEAKTHAAAAVNAFMLGRDVLAIERVDAALALAPSELSPYEVKVFAAYFNGNYSAAREDLQKLLGSSSDSRKSYPALWLYLATRRLGEDGSDAVRQHMAAAAASPWPYPILQMFMGTATFEQALRAAREGTPDPSRLCELYFYAGEKALLDGDVRGAREFFAKSVNTGVVEFNEYAMAKRRMTTLETR